MKKTIVYLSLYMLSVAGFAQEKTIKLNTPSKDRGFSMMKSLGLRASASDFDTSMLKIEDLSDLLWSANGVNRENGKRTAPSAMNSKDVDVYVVMKKGTYLYDADKHSLNLVVEGDHRHLAAGRQNSVAKAPVFCLLISDISRFKGNDTNLKLNWAASNAGIVSQNISLFCASVGLSTRPRATMEIDQLRKVLKLKDSQYPVLNHPVSYKKD